MRIPEPYRGMHKAALKQGWTVTPTGGSGHLAWKTPDGKTVFSPSSPGDGRGVHRVRAKLRRAGLKV
jgi:predicted RNA binding protein YcfA (HicA-like mRNA interferase family)